MSLSSIWDDAVNAFCRWLCRTFPSRHRVILRNDGAQQLEQFLVWPLRVKGPAR